LLAEDDRLSPDAIAAAIRARGCAAQAFASAEEIAGHLATNARSGDLVLIMSNGSFDGLTAKLFERLHAASGVRA
jgi:UDP-N-acetylmuramate: L-alanyl-gamma-D-glutamyl-meso-diaminopimelate ligase